MFLIGHLAMFEICILFSAFSDISNLCMRQLKILPITLGTLYRISLSGIVIHLTTFIIGFITSRLKSDYNKYNIINLLRWNRLIYSSGRKTKFENFVLTFILVLVYSDIYLELETLGLNLWINYELNRSVGLLVIRARTKRISNRLLVLIR